MFKHEEYTNIYLIEPNIGEVTAKLHYSFNYPQNQKFSKFFHAFSGRDTSSAFLILTKIFMKFVTISPEKHFNIFLNKYASSEDIGSSSEQIALLALRLIV